MGLPYQAPTIPRPPSAIREAPGSCGPMASQACGVSRESLALFKTSAQSRQIHNHVEALHRLPLSLSISGQEKTPRRVVCRSSRVGRNQYCGEVSPYLLPRMSHPVNAGRFFPLPTTKAGVPLAGRLRGPVASCVTEQPTLAAFSSRAPTGSCKRAARRRGSKID